jgi:membrane protein DedA with SNARE-associated domain
LGPTLGTAGWTALIAGAGYKLGENYTDVEKILGPAANAILVILVLGYIYRVWTHRHMPIEEKSKPDLTSL